MNNEARHSFVIPAYGYSVYLKDCIDSLRSQTVVSEIVVSTSTPSSEIKSLCENYDIRLNVHSPNRGIANDWNQALRSAKNTLVTIAHQDDVYYPDFAERTLESMGAAGDAVLAFSDYEEITVAGPRRRNRLLVIKQLLLHAAFLGRRAIRDSPSKRNALRFACPIPCPAVTLDVSRYHGGFDESFQINLDWAAWLRAVDTPGSFVWIREVLMGHRIHEESETSAAIMDGRRAQEDFYILRQLWPESIARRIVRSYGAAYKSNQVET